MMTVISNKTIITVNPYNEKNIDHLTQNIYR